MVIVTEIIFIKSCYVPTSSWKICYKFIRGIYTKKLKNQETSSIWSCGRSFWKSMEFHLRWYRKNIGRIIAGGVMINCFCSMVDWQKVFSFISSRDHCQRPSPLQIFDTLRADFEPVQNLISSLVEWSCSVVITTTPRRH